MNVNFDIKKRVLDLVIDCKSNPEIAKITGYSEANIKWIVRDLFRKYNVKKRSELIVYILKNGA